MCTTIPNHAFQRHRKLIPGRLHSLTQHCSTCLAGLCIQTTACTTVYALCRGFCLFRQADGDTMKWCSKCTRVRQFRRVHWFEQPMSKPTCSFSEASRSFGISSVRLKPPPAKRLEYATNTALQVCERYQTNRSLRSIQLHLSRFHRRRNGKCCASHRLPQIFFKMPNGFLSVLSCRLHASRRFKWVCRLACQIWWEYDRVT